MNFCLSDLVPPLRWSDASTITLLTGQPDLPDAWWRSLPMPSVLAAIGPEPLGELLTEIALEHWPAAAIGDVLPALHVLDPEEADEPAVAIALDRAGSWAGLLALTSRELVDQPFIQARPVLNTLFSAVLVRIAHPHGEEAAPGLREVPAPAVVAHEPADHAAVAHEPERSDVADAAESVAAAPERGERAEEAVAEPVAAQHAAEGVEERDSDERHASPEHAAPELTAEEPAAEEPAADQQAAELADAEPVSEAAHADDQRHEPREAEVPHEPAPHEAEASDERAEVQEGVPSLEAVSYEGSPSDQEVPPDQEVPSYEGAVAHEGAAGYEGEPAERVVDADAEPVSYDAPRPEPDPEPEPVLDAAEELAPDPAAQEAAALEAAAPEEAAQEPPAHESATPEPATSEPAAHEAAPPEDAAPEAEGGEPAEDQPVPAQAAAAHEQELPELIETAFAGLDDKSWAVAQNRVFTDEPSAVDQLAKLFAVPPAEIAATEEELRSHLDRWLASDAAAPYRAHLDELVRTFGTEAPREQLIGAADWHHVEIRALEIPAWQFVLTTLAPPPPPQVELPPPPLPQRKPYQQQQQQQPVEVAPSAFGPMQMPPPPPPGPPQFQAFAPVTPPVSEANGGVEEQDKPYQPLKDVSQTRRCFRQPDGRWWLRIDVTVEQLAGGECVLPTGFASYLGLSPGESRTVRSAAGELTMIWHGKPVLQSIERLLVDVGAKEGGHLFLTLSDEGVLRARHLPVAAQGAEKITKALRLVGYTAPGGTRDQAARVIATRIGMTGPVALQELLDRLRERGDRDLLELLD